MSQSDFCASLHKILYIFHQNSKCNFQFFHNSEFLCVEFQTIPNLLPIIQFLFYVLLTLVQMEKREEHVHISYITSMDTWFRAMKVFTVLSLLESLAVLTLIRATRSMVIFHFLTAKSKSIIFDKIQYFYKWAEYVLPYSLKCPSWTPKIQSSEEEGIFNHFRSNIYKNWGVCKIQGKLNSEVYEFLEILTLGETTRESSKRFRARKAQRERTTVQTTPSTFRLFSTDFFTACFCHFSHLLYPECCPW